MSGFLVLEDGSVFRGRSVGALGVAHGEAVFTTAIVQLVMVSAVDFRRRCPANDPSPRNAPEWSMATREVWPPGERTDKRTRPLSMYITSVPRSPCAKTVSNGSSWMVIFAM